MRPRPDVAKVMRAEVSRTCRGSETWRRWRRKTGKSPKTWMEKRVRVNTEWVEGRREASTVEAMRAALVLRLEGKGGVRELMFAALSESAGAERKVPDCERARVVGGEGGVWEP